MRRYCTEELICPYCGHEQYTHEPDDISADMCLTECENCGRPFWYSVTVTRSYDSYKDDNCEDADDNEESVENW